MICPWLSSTLKLDSREFDTSLRLLQITSMMSVSLSLTPSGFLIVQWIAASVSGTLWQGLLSIGWNSSMRHFRLTSLLQVSSLLPRTWTQKLYSYGQTKPSSSRLLSSALLLSHLRLTCPYASQIQPKSSLTRISMRSRIRKMELLRRTLLR